MRNHSLLALKQLAFPVLVVCQICPSNVVAQTVGENLSVEQIRLTVEELADLIEKNYFDEALAKQIGQALRDQLTDGGLSALSSDELARELTQTTRQVVSDLHLNVVAESPTKEANNETSKTDSRSERAKRENYGVRSIEILDGNVGYLDLRYFYRPDEAKETLAGATQLLQHADALILDLRRNGGGSPETIALFLSGFFEQTEKPLFNIIGRTGEPQEFSTSKSQSLQRNQKRPVYVLTSRRTFSGGEGVAFLLQEHKRAKIVGETTAGAANLARPFRVSDDLEVQLPIAKVESTLTRKNWEGEGVTPDVKSLASEALGVAQRMARTRLDARK